jgi:hypothetical protein
MITNALAAQTFPEKEIQVDFNFFPKDVDLQFSSQSVPLAGRLNINTQVTSPRRRQSGKVPFSFLYWTLSDK